MVYTPAEVRTLTPVRESIEKRAPLPDPRDVFLCHAWDDRGGPAKELHDQLVSRGVSVWRFERSGEGRVPLQALLARLSAEGRLSVLVEGGPVVHSAFLRERLADRVAIGIAPLILGGSKAPTWTRDLGGMGMSGAIEVGSLTTRRVGRDIWVEGALGASGEDDV